MHIAESITYCSSCHMQKLDKAHVDFEAYFDGPAIPQGTSFVGIDDLVICEDCLSQAGKLVGLFPAEDLKRENQQLGEAIENHQQEILNLHEIISDLERTVAKFTEVKITRPNRKPRMVEKVA